MSGLFFWLAAALLYAGFRLWYDGRRRPLTPEEIERHLAAFDASLGVGAEERETLRRFLEQDDGGEFVMLNLVRLEPGEIPHPETGEPTRASALLRSYMRGLLPLLLRRGGHPLLFAPKIGGYVDSWNAAPDPGWTAAGMVRYRSRRDMAEMATDPRFQGAHAFKVAAVPVTFSFPTSPRLTLFAGPRVFVGVALAFLASLAHLASLMLH